jgi:CYTH domain-containing protein
MTEVELELTYLAKTLPVGLAGCPSKLIVDVYYPASADHPVVRVRQNGDTYQITKKTIIDGTDSSRMNEETIHLTAEEFAGLAANGGKRVAKRRYLYDFKGYTAEVDVFQGDLAGLVVVDFEFTNRNEQQAFAMPDFCLADITQEEMLAGGVLAGKTYADIAVGLKKYGYRPLALR